MGSVSETVSFEFENIDNASVALEKCLPGEKLLEQNTYPAIITGLHMYAIEEYGEELQRNGQPTKASTPEMENCTKLGEGYPDLLVVLLEPSDVESSLPLEEIIENKESPTLGYLNNTLKFAFSGERDVFNTMIMDIRSLRPGWIRNNESEEERKKKDLASYKAFTKALQRMTPKVIVVCQRHKDGIINGMHEALCSAGKESGRTRPWIMPNRHNTTIVDCFHPGWIYRNSGRLPQNQITARQHLFKASFVVAANLLAGRMVVGNGIGDLNLSAHMDPNVNNQNDVLLSTSDARQLLRDLQDENDELKLKAGTKSNIDSTPEKGDNVTLESNDGRIGVIFDEDKLVNSFDTVLKIV